MKNLLTRIYLRYRQSGFYGLYWRVILFAAKYLASLYFTTPHKFPKQLLYFILGREVIPPRVIVPWLKHELPAVNNTSELLKTSYDTYTQTHPEEYVQFHPARTLENWPQILPKTTTNYTHPAHNLFCLHKARVLGYEGLVVTQKNQIFHEGYPWSLAELYERSICEAILSGKPTQLKGTYIHGITRSHSNYFHWMFDLVARLIVVSKHDSLKEFPILLPEELSEKQLSILGHLPLNGKKFFQSSQNLVVERLIFSSYIQYTDLNLMSYTPPQWIIEELRRVFLPLKNTKCEDVHCPKRIFLSRKDAFVRQVVNAHEIYEVLKRYGFELIEPGKFSFEAQVKIFSNADIIIGPHGAGFINLLFCNTDAKVLELFTPEFIHRAYYGLTNSMGLDYRYLVGDNRGHENIYIPVDGIVEVIRQWGVT